MEESSRLNHNFPAPSSRLPPFSRSREQYAEERFDFSNEFHFLSRSEISMNRYQKYIRKRREFFSLRNELRVIDTFVKENRDPFVPR